LRRSSVEQQEQQRQIKFFVGLSSEEPRQVDFFSLMLH
jgi:hypothetical protein